MSRNIIAILRGVLPQDAVAICEEILAAGIDRIEVPLNSPEPFDSIARIVDAMGDRALIGAGTVLSVADVDRVNAAGGRLIVSPDCNPEVIAHTKALGLQSYPGVMTPTECFTALRTGADGLKFFPGDMIGPAGLKAVRAVLPKGTEAYAVGGANPGNFKEWVAAGATGFGIGSAIFKPGDTPAEVRAKADAIVTAYDEALA
ncbi:2-dehydro-3-deoxy-6-phosphogalactonate aldolase [Cognatishimia activa]|uniref:2-dehydro-3-deoxy-6-phosphogalactonate aldolase n=1 Tax=Cognatishimia activa TaxID=1715691 RepID=A0A975ERT6_9RHOB|nr:2-dehydro-3-deoxy-6-phosphogalactonate aldolase [Cognatishimia activa]QTN37010.1 2-dehydro-3-deoxy-6-phosphogalactonate aldolase [Cognatishimia activa]